MRAAHVEAGSSEVPAIAARSAGTNRVRTAIRAVRDFDLYAAVDAKASDAVRLPHGSRLRDKAAALLRDRRKLAIVVAVVVGFSVFVTLLLVSGTLEAFYERVYTFWPGRPWTYVMRDHPWIYGLLAVGLIWLPYTLSPPDRWGRAFVSYVVFWVAFLGGHVFW